MFDIEPSRRPGLGIIVHIDIPMGDREDSLLPLHGNAIDQDSRLLSGERRENHLCLDKYQRWLGWLNNLETIDRHQALPRNENSNL